MLDLDNIPYDVKDIFVKPSIEVTQSSLGCFQECVQKYVFRYLMHLEQTGVNTDLLIGTAVHKGLEILLDPNLNMPNLQARLNLALQKVDAIFDRELEQSLAIVTNDVAFNRARAQAHACVNAWWVSVGYDFKYKVVATEHIIRVDPTATLKSDLIYRMAGMLDGLLKYKDSDSKELLLLETKTRRTLTGWDWLSGLGTDRQACWYIVLTLRRLNKPINKFVYNVIGKPQHTAKLEWQALFERMYNAMIEDPGKYFTYPDIILDADILDRQYCNWQRTVEKMDWLEPDDVTMTTDACMRWGKPCPYKVLCDRGADAACPEKVLNMPESNMLEFRKPFSELEDDTYEE